MLVSGCPGPGALSCVKPRVQSQQQRGGAGREGLISRRLISVVGLQLAGREQLPGALVSGFLLYIQR